MTAALLGAGAISRHGKTLDARAALESADMAPLILGPKEGLALLNGTQTSTALALAALFEAERVFQAALVTGALTTDAAKGSDGPFDARIHDLRGHRGQIPRPLPRPDVPPMTTAHLPLRSNRPEPNVYSRMRTK